MLFLCFYFYQVKIEKFENKNVEYDARITNFYSFFHVEYLTDHNTISLQILLSNMIRKYIKIKNTSGNSFLIILIISLTE